jgi:hypothetical protein
MSTFDPPVVTSSSIRRSRYSSRPRAQCADPRWLVLRIIVAVSHVIDQQPGHRKDTHGRRAHEDARQLNSLSPSWRPMSSRRQTKQQQWTQELTTSSHANPRRKWCDIETFSDTSADVNN